ncbi:hypothetical protein PYW08_000158 [Mythimna loreyi]|uniref:Uncharacterized protein n=1 Tax=Mythimna loreyi TaxID=667449 RepID=A0ACC2RA68_9NEOP|nr:hypothetical protein PYW08_000158 [Mythimna loreyi]
MALKTETGFVSNSLGIRVEGELQDFRIIEEKSDSDDDESTDKCSRTIDTIATIPSSLVKASSTPIGNVAVSNSENVTIGNNTYFNGPVIIKQVIQNTSTSPGLENPSYVKTEDDDVPAQKYQSELKNDNSITKFHLRRWHKITFLAVCIVVLGGIFAILSIILSNSSQDDSSPSSPSMSEEDKTTRKSNYTKVVGTFYENLNLIIFTIILATLIFLLMFYTLLTFDGSGGEKSVVTDFERSRKKRDYEAILDDYDPYIIKANPLLIAPDHLRIVPRSDWLAQPVENSLDKIRQPVPWVIISHTATESCRTQSECVLRVRIIQSFHIESRKWDDIGYNFLVAGDGSAYFGRGWDYVGAHTLGYNKYSIGISFIGTFNNDPPPQNQIDACLKLIKRGVQTGKLAKDYKLFAHRQLASTLSPGDKLYDIIKEWPHFVKNVTNPEELVPNY